MIGGSEIIAVHERAFSNEETHMHALKISARIDSNHRLEIQLPDDAPEGDAEVIVLIPSVQSTQAAGLRSYFEKLDCQPALKQNSKAKVDAYLAKERASWD